MTTRTELSPAEALLAQWEVWQRARNQGGDSGKLVWAVAIGATLAAPGVIFPLALTLVDVIANAGISVYQATQ